MSSPTTGEPLREALGAVIARWNKAEGKVLPGLTKRRAAEAALYRLPA